MERETFRRVVLGQVAITIVLVLSSITAVLALRSTVHQDEHIIRIDERILELETLRERTRELARSGRRYLLTGDLAERQQATELADQVQRSRTDAIALTRQLDDFAVSVRNSMKDDRGDPSAIQRFETNLDLVRQPLAAAFDEEMSRLRLQREAARSSRDLATGAQWALVFAAVLGLGLGLAGLLLVRRLVRQLETRARAVDQSAERSNRSRTELLAAAEELSRPLHLIVERAEKLGTLRASSVEQRGLESIAEAARSVETRLRQLLDVTGIQLGRTSITRELFSVAPVIDHSVRQYERVAAERGVSLRAEPAGLLSVVADRERMGLVIGSHLEQAIECATSGSEIVITAATHGNGIRIAFLQPMLAPASRPASTAEDDLASSFCRSIIEAHGGRMGIETSPLGQTRWFTLPSEPNLLR